MTTYINMKDSNGDRETVDEFETFKEAREMLTEYQRAQFGNVYLSSRMCANWMNERTAMMELKKI